MPRTEELLKQVAQDIFERLAFMIPEQGASANREEQPVYRAVVVFTGEFAGSIQVEMPESMLPELARNMLGLNEDDTVSETQCLDALGEFTNVFCGNLLARLVGPEPEFNLDPPRVKVGGEPEIERYAVQIRVELAMEEGWAGLHLQLDDDGAAVLAACAGSDESGG